MKKSFKEFININDLPVPSVDFINKLQEKITDLENKNNASRDNIKFLEERISELENINQALMNSLEDKSSLQKKENDELRKENEKLKKEISDLKSSINIIFTTRDKNVHCSLICNKNDDFKTIENRFYDKFPDYKETESENTFSVRNNNIDKSKTLEDNSIRDNDLILLN